MDDWKKLQRLMQYSNGNKGFFSTLHADNMSMLRWFIDRSHATHPYCKGHTGAGLTLGKGTLCNTSRKQRMNTRSSTETELVSVYDVMPAILWTRQFLQDQGYTSTETVVNQGNQSAILLENHGKFSSTKRTKHIEIRYFYITNKVKKREAKIVYCPTDKMIADYFTKPLQGSIFKKFRDVILNLKE